jgi:hypothetical protein
LQQVLARTGGNEVFALLTERTGILTDALRTERFSLMVMFILRAIADRAHLLERRTRHGRPQLDHEAAIRLAHPEHEIIDVRYADLVRDPLGTVETMYAACDREFDDRARTALSASIGANPKGRFGTHGYRLGDFGLRTDELRERFAEYVERYDIPAEVNTG